MNPRLLVLVLITFQLLGGYMILDSFLHHQRDKPGCQMSYSRPSFIPIPVPHSRLTEKYSLYLYREGGIDPDNRLLGVPTLFIPGHAGSYKQARSIAAESAYYYQGLSFKDYRYGLDVFTVDLNEEFSAIAGGLIYDQAEYLNDAIKQILAFYQPIAEHQGRPVPSSVIVVGHSMGGIVARIMQHLPNYVTGSVNTIFTLATPHTMPPIVLDTSTDMIYHRYLSQPLNNTMLVSVAGGTQDIIVNSDAAILPSTMSFGLTVFTTAVPGVWTGCDHMAILWCNQLVKKVAAALVDIVDIRSSSQTAPLDKRRLIFEKHLFPTNQVVLDSKRDTVTISTNAIYIDRKDQQRFELSNQHQLVYSLNQKNEPFGILTNLQDLYLLRLRLCKDGAVGLECTKVESGFQMIPSFGNGEKHPYKSDTLPFWLLDFDHGIWKNFDLLVLDYDGQQQTTSIKSPFIKIGAYGSSTAKGQTDHTSLFYLALGGGTILEVNPRLLGTNYHFPDIQSPLLAFKLSLVNQPYHTTDDLCHQSLLIQQIFYGESKFHLLSNETFAPIHLHRGPDNTNKDGLMMTIWPHQKDNQTLQLLLELDLYGSLGKCVLRLGPAIPMCLFIVSLSFLVHQLAFIDTSGDVATALTEWMGKGMYSLSSLYVLVIFVCGLDRVWPGTFDQLIVGTDSLPLFLWWLPLTLYVLATGLFVVLSTLMSLILYGLSNVVSPSQKFGYIHVSISVLLCSCFGRLPTSVVVVLMYLQWILLCAASYTSAKASNDTQGWIRCRYLFGILMLWTSSLPYHIPGAVIYIRDLMVGWKFTSSSATLLNDAPTIVWLTILFIIGRSDELWKSSSSRLRVARILCGFILYYTLVGIQHPFSLHHYFSAILAENFV